MTTPFFLFPERYPLLTVLALITLGGFWLGETVIARSPFPANPLNLALLLLASGTLGGVLVTADPDLTLPKATGILLGFAALRWLISIARSPSLIAFTTAGLLLTGSAMTAVGLADVNWLVKFPALAPILQRLPFGTVSFAGSAQVGTHTNQLAGTLLLFLFPFIWLGAQAWGSGRRLLAAFLWLNLGLWTSILFLTQSRAGWVGFLVGLLTGIWIGLFLKREKPAARWGRWLLSLVCIIIVAAAAARIGPVDLPSILLDPPDSWAIGDLNSLTFRREVWSGAASAVDDFFITGPGLGTFRRVVRRLYPLNIHEDYDIAHAHNLFIQAWLDLGLAGLIGYAALLVLVGRLGVWILANQPAWRPLTIGLLANLAAFHTFGLIDALAFGSKTHLLFWLHLALIAGIFTQANGQQIERINR